MGKLTVFSGLGEPLNAEIELTADKEELTSLSARIAPAETYVEQGLQRGAMLSALRLEVTKPANGNSVLKLTTTQPVNDPFLDMLIQLEWSSGRLSREYTALLDPPGFGDQKFSAQMPPVAPAVTTVPGGASTENPAQKKSAGSRKAVSTTAPAAEEKAPAGDTYTTRSGDTLRGVAKQMQVDGASLEQMLVGLYRTNPDAFIRGNMNRLKIGQIVRAPAPEELQSLSQEEAVKEIRVHTSDWHAYRQKLASDVMAAPEGESVQGQSSSGKVMPHAEDKAAPAAAGPRDVVKLSKSDTTFKVAGPETPAKPDKVEDVTARDKAVRDADARAVSLEKQLQDMQKLLEVKSKLLDDLQKGAAAPAKPKEPPPPVAAPEVKKPAEAAPVASKPAEPNPTEAQPVEAKPAEVQPVAEAKPEAPKKPKKPKHRPVVAPEPTPEPSLLDDPLVLGGVGGGLATLLGVGWLYLRNKRRKSLESFEQGILTTSGLKPNTVFGSASGGMIDTGDTSFLTDLSHGSSAMIDTNDVDPIAEAEVYMAYGRDVQAEEILKDAIGKDPKRYELHQKLLEIYSNRKDTSAFEVVAGELYTTLGPTDSHWQKIASMGRVLEPENPLYQPDGIPSAASASVAQEVAGTVDAAALPVAPAAELGSSATDDTGLDFDLGVSESLAETPADSASLISEDTLPPLDIPLEDTNPSDEEDFEAVADAGMDFSFELPEPAMADNVQLEAEDLGLPEEFAPVAEASDAMPELDVIGSEQPEEALAPEDAFEGIDLDFSSLGETVEAAPQVAQSDTVTMDTLELPDMPTLESAAVGNDLDAPAEDVMPAIDVPSLEMETPAEAESPAETPDVFDTASIESPPVDEEIVLESTPDGESALDLDFDAGLDVPETESALMSAMPEAAAEMAPALPELDLTGISLDLDAPAESPAEPEAESASTAIDLMGQMADATDDVEEITLSGSESADVDTKLDLVSAYLDMGDQEGARELLEEVLREGGPQQRERAQGLLDSIG